MTWGVQRGKRAFDVIGAATALLLLSPLLLLTAAAVRVKLGAPILFSQCRPGLGSRPFTLYKFRTMTSERDSSGRLLEDVQRLTPIGRWIRATSLDELPELINVLRGDMSLVGPRPLLMEYLPLYTSEQARRHQVRPGLTGLAQVSGRNASTWQRRLELDVEYVDSASPALDVRILLRTVVSVLRREGISQSGHPTMERFQG